MNNIKFGAGTFIGVIGGDTTINLGSGIPADDCIPENDTAIKALRNIGEEATLSARVRINKLLWYKILYRKSWHWPVSNNWLRMHGYAMRHR